MDSTRPGGPLPRPNQERLDLPDEQHMSYWLLVIREFDWTTSRKQAQDLYKNVVGTSHEGEVSS